MLIQTFFSHFHSDCMRCVFPLKKGGGGGEKELFVSFIYEGQYIEHPSTYKIVIKIIK